jgi:xylulokinase
MMTIFMALDVGTTGTKAVLIDDQMNVLESAYQGYETHTEGVGIVEQNAGDWWTAAQTAARSLDGSRVDGIVLTGQMQDVILLDGAGHPVRPVILYSDTRATEEAAWVNAQIGTERLATLTGYDQEAGSLLAKLRWLQRHDAVSLEKAAHLLIGAADVVAQKLTGQYVTDITTAATSGLVDLNTRTWLAHGPMTYLNLTTLRPLFPRLVPGGTQVGTVTAEGAALFGIAVGLPVYLGPGDAGAATLGMGGGVPGRPYAYVGTSGWIALTSPVRGDPARGVWTLPHPVSDLWIGVAPLLTAGGGFEWMRSIINAPDVGTLIDGALNAHANPESLAQDRLIYLPYLNGERSPIKDPAARGAFIGLTAQHTAEDLSYAVLEGTAFAFRHALEALVQGVEVQALALTGGGVRSPGWNQMLADVLGVPTQVAAEPEHTTIRGAVMAAQGHWNIEPRMEAVYTPNQAAHEHHSRRYAWFREAYPSLRGLFGAMR